MVESLLAQIGVLFDFLELLFMFLHLPTDNNRTLSLKRTVIKEVLTILSQTVIEQSSVEPCVAKKP